MLKHVKTPFHSWDLMRVLDCQALFSEFHSLKMLRASPQSPAWSRRHPSLVDKSMRCIVKKMFSYGYFWVEQNDVTWSIWHNQIQKKVSDKKVSKNRNFPEPHRFSQSLCIPLWFGRRAKTFFQAIEKGSRCWTAKHCTWTDERSLAFGGSLMHKFH